LDEEQSSIYVKSDDLTIPTKISGKEDQMRRVFDPAYYIKTVESYQKKINIISNP